jgi:hypothetical protein
MRLTLNDPETLEGEQRMHQENLPKERVTHKENQRRKMAAELKIHKEKDFQKPQINTRWVSLRSTQFEMRNSPHPPQTTETGTAKGKKLHI